MSDMSLFDDADNAVTAMQVLGSGALSKMTTSLTEHDDGQPARVQYQLVLGEQSVDMNALIGKSIRLQFLGAIHCSHCDRKTNKSFGQGYCYPCFKKLPQCDQCIVSPEKCHYHLGTCRDAQWGEQFCFQDHYVYLANSSGVKVGITRGTQLPTRWLDQGAIQALPILKVATRLQSGKVERLIGEHVTDRTNWRAMLKGDVSPVDLLAERDRLFGLCADGLHQLEQEYGLQAIQRLPDAQPVHIAYPVTVFPSKVTSLNLDKTPLVEGKLMGIKGQYLMLDTGVINLRKYTAYQVALSA